ncbi:MAG: hypothetical protein MI754_02830 [Chromatiales bacterium]|nr:hypothetical protein [Chromatiales bacterium]
MLNTANLSLEQAPPISIPFRFFLTAPLFGLLAGLLMLYYGPDMVTSRWSPATLALTHALTLGVMSMVMCGAMMQMLPVLAGSPLPRVREVGTVLHLAMIIGTLGLVLGFISSDGRWFGVALSALAVGFAPFFVALFVALIRVKVLSPTILGMRFAGTALLVTIGLGMLVLMARVGWLELGNPVPWVDTHLSWGLVGWVGLLLVSVAYQVVPMFHVTPEYPEWLRGYLTKGLFGLLIVWTLVGAVWPTVFYQDILMLLSLGCYVLFALQTLKLFQQKRRKVKDATLLFWRVSLVGIVLAVGLWAVMVLFSDQLSGYLTTFVLLIGAVVLLAAVAVINAMLYKIVPFLSWFHLQHRQLALMSFTVSVPHMKAFLADKHVKRQSYLWLASALLLLLAIVVDGVLIYPGALLFVIANLYLFINLALIYRLYRQVSGQLDEAAGPTPVAG